MCTSRIVSFSNLSPLYRLLYPRMLFLIVRLQRLTLWYRVVRICLLNEFSISSLFVSHKQNTSSMNLFHVSGLLTIDAIKTLAKATAILVPMAVPFGDGLSR